MKTVVSAVLVLVLVLFASPATSQEPFEGETLISLLTSTETYLIDIDQNIIKTWHGDAVPATFAYMLPDYSIIRPCVDSGGSFGGGGVGGRLQKIDADDNVVWDYYSS